MPGGTCQIPYVTCAVQSNKLHVMLVTMAGLLLGLCAHSLIGEAV